jgi:hypothetical protein
MSRALKRRIALLYNFLKKYEKEHLVFKGDIVKIGVLKNYD